jgi:CheY-like chemotaxis protein
MSGKRILVVDDDRQMVLLLTRILQGAGYSVLSALDAAQGVMQAHRQQPDLVVLDLVMPAGGGLTVLDRLRASMKTTAIPIIVLTASDLHEAKARATAAGAVCVLPKPCEPQVLLAAVSDALNGTAHTA